MSRRFPPPRFSKERLLTFLSDFGVAGKLRKPASCDNFSSALFVLNGVPARTLLKADSLAGCPVYEVTASLFSGFMSSSLDPGLENCNLVEQFGRVISCCSSVSGEGSWEWEGSGEGLWEWEGSGEGMLCWEDLRRLWRRIVLTDGSAPLLLEDDLWRSCGRKTKSVYF